MRCKHGKAMLVFLVVVAIIAVGYFTMKGKDSKITAKEEKSKTEQSVQKDTKAAPAPEAEIKEGVTGAEATAPMAAGTYEVYDAAKLAKAKEGKVVLFFRATWCPSCKALDTDIHAHLKDIPQDVTILDVDYDKYTDLKKKYGVTMQHTMVQVDAEGNQIQKWSASPTLSDLIEHIK